MHTPRRLERASKLGAASALGVALLASSPRAHAADFEVQADSAFQAYEVTDPWGDTVLERRRLMQTLALGAYNLQGAYKPGKADYSVALRMRLNVDFGINSQLSGGQAGGETTYVTGDNSQGVHYIPGLEVAPLDLMYGYVEGRNLANGWFGFRLGRQYMTDVLGWWGFDGGLARITTPFFVQAEVYGGLEQRGGMPLTTSRWERQGVWRGSHSGWGGADKPIVTDYPSFLLVEPAPAFGFALESNGPSFVHGRFSYRRVYNTGATITSQFPDPSGGYKTVSGTRISQERFGYAADIDKSDLGGIKGGFTYDLYSQIVGSYYGGLEAYLGRHATVGADIDYFVPTFDADSIWNWFTKSPITTITGRTAIRFTKRFDIAASGGVRLWTADGNPDTFASGQCKSVGLADNCLGQVSFDPNLGGYSRVEDNRKLSTTADGLGNLSGRYRFNTAVLSVRSMLETGSRGRRAGGDVDGEKKLDGDRYTLGARVSLYNWVDPLRLNRDGKSTANPAATSVTSFGYVLAAGFKPGSIADLRVEWEHDMNELVGMRYRIVGLLNLGLTR